MLDESLTYTVPQVAKLLGIGRRQAYEATKRGEIPSIRIGSSLRVPKKALHQMIDTKGGKAEV